MGGSAERVTYEVTNAVLGWLVTGAVLVAGVSHALSGDLLWAGMAAAVVVVGVLPAAVSHHPREMVPWEVLGIAAIPVVAFSVDVLVEQMAYVAVAALSLAVAVELDAFTSLELTPSVAVGFVVVVTMANAGLWTIVRYASDVWLGTSLLVSEDVLMWDLAVATGVGIVAGVVFELYFRRLSPGHTLARELWGTAQ